MAVFLTLSPFAVFSVMMSMTHPVTALFGGAAVAFGLIVWDWCRGRSLKLLQSATLTLLLAIGAYASLFDVTSHAARLALDIGLIARDANVAGAALSLHDPVCPRTGRARNRRASGIPARQLRADLGLGGRPRFDAGCQHRRASRALAAAVDRAGRSLCRTQRRRLVHAMVPGATPRPAEAARADAARLATHLTGDIA